MLVFNKPYLNTIVLILVLLFTALTFVTEAHSQSCEKFLKNKSSNLNSELLLSPAILKSRVKWDTAYDIVMDMLIVHYEPAQLTAAFVAKLSKTDLIFLVPHINAAVTGASIIAQTKYRYGSWYKALEAKGVSSIEVVGTHQSLTPDQILAIIKKLSPDHNLNSNTVRKLEIYDPSILSIRNNHSMKGGAFYAQAVAKFGNWDKVLKAAGFDPKIVKNKHPRPPIKRHPNSGTGRLQWTNEKKDLIIDLLREEFGDEKISFGFVRALTENDLAFATEKLGFQTNGESILNAYRKKNHPGWYDVLKAKGVNVELIRTRNHLSLEEIGVLLKKIHIEHNLNSHSIQKLSAEEIYRISGVKISGNALYEQLYTKSELPWYDFLAKIGLDEVKPHSTLTGEQIIHAIQEIAKKQNPNFRAVLALKKADLEYLNLDRGGAALLAGAINLFGSWDQALVAAGLNPDKIRLARLADYQILTPAMKQQRQRMYEYSVNFHHQRAYEFIKKGTKDLVVTDHSTAESSVLKQEVENSINGALKTLSEKEQWMFDLMTDKMLEQSLRESYEGFNLSNLISEIINFYENISATDIKDLFRKISTNEDLRDALLNP